MYMYTPSILPNDYRFTGESIRGGLRDLFDPGLALLLHVH
jgi:hypothetical protein